MSQSGKGLCYEEAGRFRGYNIQNEANLSSSYMLQVVKKDAKLIEGGCMKLKWHAIAKVVVRNQCGGEWACKEEV